MVINDVTTKIVYISISPPFAFKTAIYNLHNQMLRGLKPFNCFLKQELITKFLSSFMKY